jgi:F-type H+-transporting ATPase subunit gamma
MESIEQVKNRIESIAGTKQITQSMRLVSTARLKRVRDRMAANLPFLQAAARMAREAAAEPDAKKHRYVRPAREGSGACVIAIAADRGLCGGYNLNVCREARALMQETNAEKVIAVGRKAKEFFARRMRDEGGAEKAFTGISETPFFEDAEQIAACALAWFNSGEIGSVYLVHTRFVNMLTLPPVRTRLLPIDTEMENNGSSIGANSGGESGANSGGESGANSGGYSTKALISYEPDSAGFLDHSVQFYLSAAIFGAMLEASVCEQSARITGMDAAVKNSEDMIEDLTRAYNRARQGGITEELADIIGGASALRRKAARSAGV